MKPTPDLIRITPEELEAVVLPERPSIPLGRSPPAPSAPVSARGRDNSRAVILVGVVLGLLGFVMLGIGTVVYVLPELAQRGLLEYGVPAAESVPIETTSEVRAALEANCRVACDKGFGSGVVLAREQGAVFVLTNHHVVECGLPKVQFAHGTESHLGRVVWTAPHEVDLVLVRIDGVGDAESPAVARTGRTEPLKLGEPLFAIGNPLGLHETYTAGPLSAVRPLDGAKRMRVLQAQVALNPGNSGGGLYDAQGRLLGINTWMSLSPRSRNLGFALSFEDALQLVKDDRPELAAMLLSPSPLSSRVVELSP